jgi:hypothetical protein
MPSNIIFRKTTNGLGGNSTAEEVSAAGMNNIFDDVSKDEALAGDTEYRAIDLFNNGNATAVVVTAYLTGDTVSNYSVLHMGALAATGGTLAIANESTAPAGVTFAERLSGNALSLPDIPAGSYVRLWLKRTIGAGAENIASDGTILEVSYA